MEHKENIDIYANIRNNNISSTKPCKGSKLSGKGKGYRTRRGRENTKVYNQSNDRSTSTNSSRKYTRMENGESFLSRVLLTCCTKENEPTSAPTISSSPSSSPSYGKGKGTRAPTITLPPATTTHGKGKGGKGKGGKCHETDTNTEGRWGSASVPWNGAENLGSLHVMVFNCATFILALRMMEFL
jgi:hypothetical protein